MVDMNGDGNEEAIAFFRKNADEKPLKIVVFRPEDDNYVPLCTIESSGTAVESVSYEDLTGDDGLELVVGWKIGTDVQTVAVYEVGPQPGTLMQSSYARFTTCPLEGEQDAMVVLRANSEGGMVADLYGWKGDALAVVSSCALSSTMAELNRGAILTGHLDEETTALFITGVSDQDLAATDVLVCEDGALRNVVTEEKTGTTRVVNPFRQLLPQDIDGDGLVEIPAPEDWADAAQTDGLVEWMRYDRRGREKRAAETYHSQSSGWYFLLDDNWHGRIAADASESSSLEPQVTLSVDGNPVAALYAISGENRENRATRGDRIKLRTQTTTIYAGELLENAEWYDVNEDFLREHFRLIVGSWSIAEN
jgi:hypothetical protein